MTNDDHVIMVARYGSQRIRPIHIATYAESYQYGYFMCRMGDRMNHRIRLHITLLVGFIVMLFTTAMPTRVAGTNNMGENVTTGTTIQNIWV
jgi:hypothetical protein